MGKFGISAGHNPDGKIAYGAIGTVVIDGIITTFKESTEARKLVKEVNRLLLLNGHEAKDFTVDNGTSASDVLNKLVAKHNAYSSDMNISIHFNSGASDERGNGKTTGVEVLVYNSNSDNSMAKRVSENIAKEMGYSNRGLKERPNLAFLRGTKGKSMIIEVCFVDDADDVKRYEYKKAAQAIVKGLLNKSSIVTEEQTSNTMYKYCILYSNSVDKTIAEVFAWNFDDYVVMDVKDFKSGSAHNLFVIGGRTDQVLKSMNILDRYTVFNGVDRWDTLDKVIKYVKG